MVKRDSLFRLRLIDEALQKPSGVSLEELKTILGVNSNSTIRNYIGFKKQSNVDINDRKGIMWGEFWPERMIKKYNPKKDPEGFNKIITKEGGKYKYSYSDFSLFNNEFSDISIEAILNFIDYCHKVMGLNDNFTDVILALSEIIETQKSGKFKPRIDKILNSKSTMKISLREVFPSEGYLPYKDFISVITDSITNKNPITITYKPFDNPKSNVLIHPYFVCESNSRWYVIGYISEVREINSVFIKNNRLEKINNLALERITKIRVEENKEYAESKVDVENILENSFGPSIYNWENPEIVNLVIKTIPGMQKHFETMPLKFNTQQSNKGCVFTYKNTVVSNELFYTLRQYGDAIEIIAPATIRKKFIEDIKSVYDKYK
jgi:predicted DNA-binding transcriptional regulator YafY